MLYWPDCWCVNELTVTLGHKDTRSLRAIWGSLYILIFVKRLTKCNAYEGERLGILNAKEIAFWLIACKAEPECRFGSCCLRHNRRADCSSRKSQYGLWGAGGEAV